ncbi:hypothetical protein [Actinoplanes subtropicus]|uniref:hypothetical protein n=1 Tax=Actinoplanes subtropicus TaxID=543632 RepID=UPI0004C3BE1E|nr:hypothetical protein [Actinoplanes subtropicus]
MVLLALAGLQTLAPPAYANRNCESPHCYSQAFYTASGLIGMWSEIQENYLSIGTGYGDSNAHINSETWLLMPSGAWVEAGLRDGNDSGSWSGGCSCLAYDAFWADTNSKGTAEYRHIIESTTSTGNWDDFEFDHTSGPTWYVYFNGNYIGYGQATGSSSGKEEQAGGEYQNTTCVTGAGWADNFDIYTEVANSNGYFSPAWNHPNEIDSGCGFEGIHYRNGEFSWQKHAP